jgi:hypothetical protein
VLRVFLHLTSPVGIIIYSCIVQPNQGENIFNAWIEQRVILFTTDPKKTNLVGTLKGSMGTVVLLSDVTPQRQTRPFNDMAVNIASPSFESLELVVNPDDDPGKPKV